jgi:hypothetical protein
MNKRQLAKESGYSRPAVDELLAKGATPEDIIEKGKTRTKTQAEPKDETFLEAERRKQIALADLKELELAHKRGELVNKDEVNNFFGGLFLKARDILSHIAPELKDRLAHETDPVQIESLIDAEVRRALELLAEYK